MTRRTLPFVAATWIRLSCALSLGFAQAVALAGQAAPWAELGRVATPDEVRAWDIDVRADFKGLPAGSGSAEDGMEVWEAQCASCHGVFGESNEVFTPIVGGTTDADIARGRVASLSDGSQPQRTSLMKLSRISALWDYINRAMPWNAPKSLSVDEVYAVVAYILNLGGIVDDDFVLSDRNIAEVQARLPNRDGTVLHRGMWDVAGKPDVQGEDCMRDCSTTMDVHSMLPSHARDAHGNLALQNRTVGPVRGVDTTRDPPDTLEQTRTMAMAAAGAGEVVDEAGPSPARIAQAHNCMACHAIDGALVGPAFKAVASRYAGSADAAARLAKSVKEGSQGIWGAVPMPPNAGLAEEDVRAVVQWILDGAP
ncbi:MAG: c-type cytochrome [Burkholderiaceae bacterium]|nr:c-type cytochrome [Burkholderiaceae bacterium]MEB2318582.1 c-type cytochrome [Pseudomonadota bacterium]